MSITWDESNKNILNWSRISESMCKAIKFENCFVINKSIFNEGGVGVRLHSYAQ